MVRTLLLLATASLANAHFGVEYPPMRANTLGSNKDPAYNQYINPCAGVLGNLTDKPITPWPLSGGSLKLDLHHAWTYIFVNLGLGDNVSNFNYTLTNPFWNSTGNGTLCVPAVALPADLPVSNGTQASLQIVTVGDDGNALYNCADIVFSDAAKALEGEECKSSEGMTVAPIAVGGQQSGGGGDSGPGDGGSGEGSGSGSGSGSGNGTGSGSGEGNAGSATGVNHVALSSVVALAMVFVFGMSV